MQCATLNDLPPSTGKTGWPWTQESSQLPDIMTNGTPWPKVSIVTPSFNQGNFIEETIRSVLLQGYPNLEYIIIDGASTDKSTEIIKKYEPWLKCWISETDSGQANAINKGFRISTGEIMAWLNSDDCYMPGSIQRVVNFLYSRQNAKIVCGYRWNIGSNRIINRSTRVHLRPDCYSLSRCCYLAQETTFWKREIWDTVGELDEGYHFALDYEFWQRIMKAEYRFFLLPRYTGLFRSHTFSKSNQLLKTREQELKRIYQLYLRTIKSEKELWAEISPSWWNRTAMINRLAKAGILNLPSIAEAVVSFLTLEESRIPNNSRRIPHFYYQ